MSSETQPSALREYWQRGRGQANLVIGLAVTLTLVAVALLSLVWTPYAISVIDIPGKLQPPSA
ncbi:MAG TPA: ABC transporter permease, partial [Kiloniellaceae bacterium]|nr:ABC transporter permease [Kiloniellaceae bacterium]